jgi:hypothetical protein
MRPSERAMSQTNPKYPAEPQGFKPEAIRRVLRDNGWKEQDIGSAMFVPARPTMARLTWWNRGREFLLLLEHDCSNGKWLTAWVLPPAKNAAQARRAIKHSKISS